MRLLIIGDLDGQIGAASKIARNRGAKVGQVADIDAAFRMLCDGQGADLIMIQVDADIARFVQMLKTERINVPVIACGIQSDSKAAVRAIRSGAKEYIPLPPDEDLIAAVFEAISEETQTVIHGSDNMRQILQIADQIAQSDASVLITGESGTGKEVIARYIHRKSDRATKPFISLNCAAIPENLLESELFGHEKGAFTGAVARRIGKFEEANNGTLLLDEISEMDLHLQAKLLRAIQEREIVRIGNNKPVKINIRIIATSNRDLEAESQKGRFREDLYFRLNVINIHMPKLADRLDDIVPLSSHFIEKYSKANGMPTRRFTDAAVKKMKAYLWPGNVRELENICHRAVLMAKGDVIDDAAILLPVASIVSSNDREKLQSTPSANSANKPAAVQRPNDMVGRTVASVEKELILDTLNYCLGNRTHAANILGISIRTLRNKLKLYSDGSEGHQQTGTN